MANKNQRCRGKSGHWQRDAASCRHAYSRLLVRTVYTSVVLLVLIAALCLFLVPSGTYRVLPQTRVFWQHPHLQHAAHSADDEQSFFQPEPRGPLHIHEDPLHPLHIRCYAFNGREQRSERRKRRRTSWFWANPLVRLGGRAMSAAAAAAGTEQAAQCAAIAAALLVALPALLLAVVLELLLVGIGCVERNPGPPAPGLGAKRSVLPTC